MAKRNGLLVNISDEDEKWGIRQNRGNCAIVRSIQRQLPEALYVTADAKGIAFSLPDDGKEGTRYYGEVTPEIINNVIKPFDEGRKIDPEYRSFTVTIIAAEPMKRRTRDDKVKHRNEERRARPERRVGRASNPVVRTTNRFLNAEAGE